MFLYIKIILRHILPNNIYSIVGKYYRIFRYFGFRFKCPICGWYSREFLPFGLIKRPNAQCPMCFSLERHRMIWLYMKKTNLFNLESKKDRLRVLHFAPEKCISDKLRKLNNLEYITADLDPKKADVIMDLTNIPSDNSYYDVILCSHVLEHILDDMKAMKELYRVLKHGGWAIIQVPIGREKTFEDSLITSWEDREHIFGQGDHVRIYGLDYAERLKSAGFSVKVDPFWKELDSGSIRKYGLYKGNIYFCTK